MNAALVIPECLPGEFFSGALGRCALLNGISADEVFRILVGTDAQWRSPAIIEPLAVAFGMSDYYLINQHSIMPFMGRFAESTDNDAKQQEYLRFAADSLGKPFHRFRLCVACVKEDRAELGFAFWRTAHQLPGMGWCFKHRQVLTETRVSPRHACPDHVPEFAPDHDPGRSSIDDREASVALRFMQIGRELLITPPGPPGPIVVQRLRQRAAELGIRTRTGSFSSHSSPPMLGDYAQSRPDRDVIADLIRRVCNTDKCPWTSLNHALAWSKSGAARLCIMASILCDSLDSALWCLSSPATTQEEALRAARHEGSPIHESVLMRTYYQAHGNYQMTAQLLDKKRWTITAALKRRGLPDFKRNTDLSTINALVAFKEGFSLYEACARHAADVTHVEAFLRFGGDEIYKCATRIRESREP